MAETLPLTYNDPDHYALRLGNGFLGGDSFASPLYRELRVTRGLVYSVGSSTGFGRTRSQFSLTFGAAPSKVNQAKQLAVQVVKDMAERPMSEQELHLAKAQGLREIELGNQSASDIARGLAGIQRGEPLPEPALRDCPRVRGAQRGPGAGGFSEVHRHRPAVDLRSRPARHAIGRDTG